MKYAGVRQHDVWEFEIGQGKRGGAINEMSVAQLCSLLGLGDDYMLSRYKVPFTFMYI